MRARIFTLRSEVVYRCVTLVKVISSMLGRSVKRKKLKSRNELLSISPSSLSTFVVKVKSEELMVLPREYRGKQGTSIFHLSTPGYTKYLLHGL